MEDGGGGGKGKLEIRVYFFGGGVFSSSSLLALRTVPGIGGGVEEAVSYFLFRLDRRFFFHESDCSKVRGPVDRVRLLRSPSRCFLSRRAR